MEMKVNEDVEGGGILKLLGLLRKYLEQRISEVDKTDWLECAKEE